MRALATPAHGWFKVEASSVAHLFLDGLTSPAACGVICTRKSAWLPFQVTGEPTQFCERCARAVGRGAP